MEGNERDGMHDISFSFPFLVLAVSERKRNSQDMRKEKEEWERHMTSPSHTHSGPAVGFILITHYFINLHVNEMDLRSLSFSTSRTHLFLFNIAHTPFYPFTSFSRFSFIILEIWKGDCNEGNNQEKGKVRRKVT